MQVNPFQILLTNGVTNLIAKKSPKDLLKFEEIQQQRKLKFCSRSLLVLERSLF